MERSRKNAIEPIKKQIEGRIHILSYQDWNNKMFSFNWKLNNLSRFHKGTLELLTTSKGWKCHGRIEDNEIHYDGNHQRSYIWKTWRVKFWYNWINSAHLKFWESKANENISDSFEWDYQWVGAEKSIIKKSIREMKINLKKSSENLASEPEILSD